MTFNFGSTSNISIGPDKLFIAAFSIAVGWYVGITLCRFIDSKIPRKTNGKSQTPGS